MDALFPSSSRVPPFQSFCAAAAATLVCCLCALWCARRRATKTAMALEQVGSVKGPRGSAGGCDGTSDGDGLSGSAIENARWGADRRKKARVGAAPGEEPAAGASMMEQLVPEILMLALAYLDYSSLSRLSMTNSTMRRVANDDSPWKALYRKDFTVEQDSVTPLNGWKAYYAATKAIVDFNAEFYNIIRIRSLVSMSKYWLNARYVKCVHGSGEFFAGHASVLDSWAAAFNWVREGEGVAFDIRNVRARVVGDMAWVTMKTRVNMESRPFNVTNIFEFHKGRWYMVHHHSSIQLVDGADEPQHHHRLLPRE